MQSAIFDRAIPGQSLTMERGAAPFEHPPQFVKVDEAMEYVFDLLTTKKHGTKMLLLLKNEVPAEYIARAMLFEGFSKGKWTPDVAMLMLRPLIATILAIGHAKGIKGIKVLNPDKSANEFLDQFISDDDLNDSEDSAVEEAELDDDKVKFEGILGKIM